MTGNMLTTFMSDEAAQALTQLETLIASQQPATKPWTPVTDYSFEARKQIEGPHPQLILEIFHPRTVCDVGCGQGHLLRLLKEHALNAYCPQWVCGFDLHPPERKGDYEIWLGDVSGATNETSTYDLVLCREVLEHLTLRQLRQAVGNLCKLSDQYVYVTTRFAKAPAHFLSVDTADDLDPTHITMMTQPFLRLLFVLEGFKRRADLETLLDWQHQGRVLVYERAT